MVRRRVLTNSAKQASMNAYQQLWQQQQFARAPLVAAMPEYWHSVCNKFGGALPRMAVIAPPEVSSRKLSRLRGQLMKSHRKSAAIQSFIPNYGLQQHPQMQFQRGYHNAGNESYPSRSVSKATLLTPGCILAACQNQCYNGIPAVGVASAPQQQHLHLNQGNLFNYPGAVSPLQWQQQQYQVQQQHKQYLLQQQQQQQKTAPVGILKNSSRTGAGQQLNGDYFTTSPPPKTKKVTIRNTSPAPSTYQKPIVEKIKPLLDIPPKPNKKSKLNTLRKERQQLEQLQLQRELLKQRESIENQKKQLKRGHQNQKDTLNQTTHLEPNTCASFNFGKLADRFIKGFSCDSDTETPMFTAANAKIKTPNQGNDKPKNFSYEGNTLEKKTELQAKPKKLDLSNRESKASSTGLLDRVSKSLDLEIDSSTITLTTEQNQSKAPYQSRTSLTDKATNTGPPYPLKKYLKPGPQKATSTTSATSKGSRKMNINELLRNEKVKGLEDNPTWHSLMQLVAHMCETKESEKGDREQKNRLLAGSGADGLQKQYSVYLMVTSDEEDDDNDDRTFTKTNGDLKLGNHQGIHGGNEYVQRCSNVYQAEHPRLIRNKRSRKRLNPRLRDLSIPYPNTQTQLPMRRPLHWPKPDYSKPQGRSSRTRNPPRARSYSSAKKVVGKRSQRSLRATLDEKRSWRLWQDLPMTAKALNKAYSRMLNLSGAIRTSTEI
ncbi:uncharacterized protein LOC117137425 [Drosophila mauritiana]|uniref:Uncharacterized protein LOC117137425 n=1 Tax=Drosophila mauritiana TaxID=7226 RepID=A0A6P8JGI0_DROMA|nr:uncharacterized protein LOC117137425 [Drosophila mauritiana]